MTEPVTVLKGIGPKLAEKLERLGIRTVTDLLFHLPLRYQDRTRVVPMGSLRPGTRAWWKAPWITPRWCFAGGACCWRTSVTAPAPSHCASFTFPPPSSRGWCAACACAVSARRGAARQVLRSCTRSTGPSAMMRWWTTRSHPSTRPPRVCISSACAGSPTRRWRASTGCPTGCRRACWRARGCRTWSRRYAPCTARRPMCPLPRSWRGATRPSAVSPSRNWWPIT
jgi:hypothetical protein